MSLAETAVTEPATVEALVEGFVTGTLPRAGWTHEAHLTVGLCYLHRHGYPAGILLFRDALRRYNASQGIVSTPTSGYHETITLFYGRYLAGFLRRAGAGRPVAELVEKLLADHGDRALPLRYYSRDRLMSVEARRAWVEPDLRPLED